MFESPLDFFQRNSYKNVCLKFFYDALMTSLFLTILTWKNLCLTEKFIEKQGWLLLTFFICLYNQLSSLNSIIVQISENVIHQLGSKNEWLLLSVTFTAKLELVFVLTFENAFS